MKQASYLKRSYGQQSARKLLTVCLVFLLFVSNLAGLGWNQVQAADPIISVSEAIANNSGRATVEGYIVGVTLSGSGGTARYQHSGPFTTATNIAIADSPTETTNIHILPVQLPSGNIRSALNLVDNPQNLGKKIRITGTLEAYFSVPGLRSPTSFEIVTGDDHPDPEPSLLPIAEAKQKMGQTVIVEGVVTADNRAIGGNNLSTFMQDSTAGINIFSQRTTGFPDLKEGDYLRVTGQITEYRGLTEIIPSANGIVVLAQHYELPEAAAITLEQLNNPAIAEPLEGSLVQVRAYVTSIPSTPAGGGYNVSIIDEKFNSTTLRVMENTGAIAQLETQKWYDITAILGQYNQYQLLPRKAADILIVSPQPDAPRPAERYTSTVARVVDGDTIHLTTPVLGATTVRYVNIDTAETYHSPKNELDANQLQHGEAAKEVLRNLLPEGTEVEIKVGVEPFDAYGRLLAEVIRKEDQLNTNLEMVRLGRAVTYFIWPIDESSYGSYSEAVKQAYDAGLGIWNPEDPLLELPFVFRAREQKRDLARFVGNYSTKTYVDPQSYEEVPVEFRVFFADESEAQQAGYRPLHDNPEPSTISIQLLGMNDLHGKIDQTYYVDVTGDGQLNPLGRMDYVAAYLKEREATNPNTLIVHAGDMVGGSSPISALFQDEPTIEIMEEIGFDVGTIGNHELDEGVAEMLRLIQGGDHPNGTANYDGINFPMISANMVYKETGERVLDPYTILEIGGTRIGFIGITTKATANMVIPDGIKDIMFTDEVEAVNQAAAELKAQGVRAIIVLAHLEASQVGDVITGPVADMANRVDAEVDIIFAAHNHEIVNGFVNNKLIVQAWEYGKAFTDVDIEIDPETQDIVSKQAEIVYVMQENKTPDAAVATILAKYEELVAPILNEVVGYAAIPMQGGYATKGEIGDNALGNLIADGMRASMNADFALMNGGGIRDSLNAGPITWGELYNIQPFNNVLVKVEVTGADLEVILNAQISSYGPDYSVSGFRYTWNGLTRKVIDIYLPDGTPIDKSQTYTLVVNNFMASSPGAKYRPIGERGKNPVVGKEDLEATVDFVRSFSEPIAYAAEGRISEIIDTAAPVTTLVLEGTKVGEDTYLEQVNVYLYAEDNKAGVAKIEYSLDNGVMWNVYQQPFTLENEGEYTILFRSIDKVGNRENVQEYTFTIHQVSVDDLKEQIEAKITHPGARTSTLAQLETAERHFQKSAEERAKGREDKAQHFENLGYDALKKLKTHIQSNKNINTATKEELSVYIDYMITNKKIK